jgi:2-methylisocitrate lyase-like PEP mutase family enzyme
MLTREQAAELRALALAFEEAGYKQGLASGAGVTNEEWHAARDVRSAARKHLMDKLNELAEKPDA